MELTKNTAFGVRMRVVESSSDAWAESGEDDGRYLVLNPDIRVPLPLEVTKGARGVYT